MKYKYEKFGLANTDKMLKSALSGGYAVPAFNFYNMESLQAVIAAARETKSPVILGVSESALKYMGGEMCAAMVGAIIKEQIANSKEQTKIKDNNKVASSASTTIADCGLLTTHCNTVALHLDHGHSFESCKAAIDFGFSSVMIDGSALPFRENIALTKKVVAYAHKFGVSVEAELGALAGFEDEHTNSNHSSFTDPIQAVEFVHKTGCDSLAIAIGTSHGAYKRHSESESLRFDILKKVAKLMPELPLVLHGASIIPQDLVAQINTFGGKIKGAMGIDPAQIRRAVGINICKVNIDSDARLAWTAAVRKELRDAPTEFDPRKFLTSARGKMIEIYEYEIKKVMKSDGKM